MKEKNRINILQKILNIIVYVAIACAVFGGSSIIGEYKIFFIVLTFVALIFSQIISGKLYMNIRNILTILCMTFFVYIAISLIYTYDFQSTLNFVIIFFIMLGILLINVKKIEFYNQLLEILLNVSTFIALTILISSIYNDFIPEFLNFLMPRREESLYVFYAEMKQGIFSGIAFERAYAAFSLNIGLGILISRFITLKKLTKIDIIKLIIVLLALFCTGKRTLFLIPIIAFVLISALNNNKEMIINIFKMIPIIAILAVCVYMFLPGASKVFERFSADEDRESVDTMQIRNERYWNYAILMVKEKPFFGYGIATYKSFLQQYRSDDVYNAHNIYIQSLGELGIFGFIILISIYIVSIIINIKNIHYYQNDNNELYLANYAMFIQILFLVYGLTGNTLYYYSQLFSYIIGLSINLFIYNKIERC